MAWSFNAQSSGGKASALARRSNRSKTLKVNVNKAYRKAQNLLNMHTKKAKLWKPGDKRGIAETRRASRVLRHVKKLEKTYPEYVVNRGGR